MRNILLAATVMISAAAQAQFFPYPVQKKTLPNGLDVVVIETPEFKNVLSFNTLIMAGSGRENEKGRSGLAHLFAMTMGPTSCVSVRFYLYGVGAPVAVGRDEPVWQAWMSERFPAASDPSVMAQEAQ